ncbi:RPA family protein [Halobellus sp. GM3]|uniref:RPA family protein n=1 Tax=Halobellus sp. GM3 TaxID=3458410 RepID=UPI00403E0EE8
MMHTRAVLEATEKMATSDSQSQQGTTVPDREVAKHVFAAELNEATYTFKTSQDERAPVYVALPTGVRANRVCVMGTVTDVEDVGTDDQEYLRVRVVDPTGTFWVYAGQYQHEALKNLKKIQPPEFLAVIGKPRTYKTDDGAINVSLVPEDVGVVDISTRDIWVFEAARRTLERVESARETSPKVAALAREQYGHDGSYFAHVAAFALQNLLDGDESATELDAETIEERLEEAEAKGDDVDGEELERETLIED